MENLSLRIDGADGSQILKVDGEIDETADFGKVLEMLKDPVRIDLGGVRRINSCGVREWVNFVRQLSATRRVTLVGCSVALVEQLNMVYNFRGNASIESFYAPFLCSSCQALSPVLLTPQDAASAVAADRACGACGGTSVFDDIPERYLAFLQDLNQ